MEDGADSVAGQQRAMCYCNCLCSEVFATCQGLVSSSFSLVKFWNVKVTVNSDGGLSISNDTRREADNQVRPCRPCPSRQRHSRRRGPRAS